MRSPKSYVPWSLRPTRVLHTVFAPPARASLLVSERRLRMRPRPVGVERLDAVVVINLASRADRLVRFQSEMDRLGIVAQRFDAVADPVGIIGCTESHAECLRMLLERHWEHAMICEDDARFRLSRGQLDVLAQSFLDDARAEVACLAFHLMSPPRLHNLRYFRARETRTTACYLIKRSIAAEFLALLELGVDRLREGGDREMFGVDMIWNRLQKERVFLVPTVRAVVQEAGYSDVEGMQVRYRV